MKKTLVSVFLALLMLIPPGLASCGDPSGEPDRTDPGTVISVESDFYCLSNAEVSYFFYSIYRNYRITYADFLTYIGLDPAKPLRDQEAYSGVTWFDYFMDATKSQIRQLVTQANAAEAEGITLDADDEEMLRTLVSNLKEYASAAGMTYPDYLRSMYGSGVTEDVVLNAVRLEMLANKYYERYTGSLAYTDEEYEAYYSEHPDAYQTVRYRMYRFLCETGEDGSDEARASELREANAYAARLGEAASAEEFDRILREILSEQGKTEEEIAAAVAGADLRATSTAASEGAWLFSEDRKTGSRSEVVETEDGAAVYLVVEPAHRNETGTCCFRMIPVLAGADTDYDAAEARAEEILAAFRAGEQTGEAFGALADENGASVEGGRYENYEISAGSADEIDDWLTDGSRKAGDTGIVAYSGYGYVILFYEGDGMPAWKADVRLDLIARDFDAHIETLAETYHYICRDDRVAMIGG